MTIQEIAQKLKEVAPDAVILNQEKEGGGLVIRIVETVMIITPSGVLELVESKRANMLARLLGIPTIRQYIINSKALKSV